MSFGKRGKTAEPHVLRSRADAPPDQDDISDAADLGTSSPTLWRHLARIGIGASLSVALLVGGYAGMRAMAPPLDANWFESAGPVAWSQFMLLGRGNMKESQKRLVEACLPDIFTRRIDRTRGPRSASPPPTDMVPGLPGSELMLAKFVGDYLACTIRNVTERFCSSSERAALAIEVQTYLATRSAAIRRVEQERANRSFRDVEKGLMEAHGLYEFTNTESVLREIADALRGAMESGHLSADDVRPMNTGALAPYVVPLLEIRSAQTPCQ